MPTTTKLLVPFPERGKTEFAVPFPEAASANLLGLKTGRVTDLGLVVYVGQPVSENDHFARIVDAGMIIPDVKVLLGLLREYVKALPSLKIGNIVRLDKLENDVLRFAIVADSLAAARALGLE